MDIDLDPAWAYDLIADDPALRAAARERRSRGLSAQVEAQQWINRLWFEAGTLRPSDPVQAAEMERAFAARRAADAMSGPLLRFWAARPGDELFERTAPQTILFLEWERRYPAEFDAARWDHTRWGTKGRLLRHIGRHGVPEAQREALMDLVVAALGREYRCKDWWYARAARGVDGPKLRDRLRSSASRIEAPERAEFLLWVLDHAPGINIGTWGRWSARQRP